MVFGKHVTNVGAISLALLSNKLREHVNNTFNIPNKTNNNNKCHLLFEVNLHFIMFVEVVPPSYK